MAKKKLTPDQIDKQILASRRNFMRNAGLVLGSAGLMGGTRLGLLEELADQLFPRAMAQATDIKRMIFVGVRAGAPVLGLGTHGMFSQLGAAVVPNCPYAGNELFNTGVNGLHLTPASRVLAPHAANMAVTQGVANEGGHTDLFNFWQGGINVGATSPIIDLVEKNTSGSLLPGAHFLSGNPNGGRAVEHRTNGKPDLLNTHQSNFRDNFKRPTLMLSSEEAATVMEASVRLSRRQALKIQDIVDNPVEIAKRHHRGAGLLNVDYSELLNVNDMGALPTGSGAYGNLGASLALTLKAMSLNLLNSSTVELNIGDWHGLRSAQATRGYYTQVASKLALTVDYLKRTPEPASLGSGQTLWDTTLIAVGSEFTRVDRAFNQDNGDGGSQGIVLLGKNVKGGYYGSVQHQPSGNAMAQILRYGGLDRDTGQARPLGSMNRPSEIYHTINSLLGNAADNQQVWHGIKA